MSYRDTDIGTFPPGATRWLERACWVLFCFGIACGKTGNGSLCWGGKLSLGGGCLSSGSLWGTVCSPAQQAWHQRGTQGECAQIPRLAQPAHSLHLDSKVAKESPQNLKLML